MPMNKMLILNRNFELDALRAFAILYIVVWLHLHNFITRLEVLLTYYVLGLFSFISGLLLTTSYRMNTGSEIRKYYK